MGCGCGGGGSQIEQWQVIFPDGTRDVAASEVQARQWIARAGGGVMRRVQVPAKV